MAERLNGKMKTLKATTLVLLLGIFSFGVYHVGRLGTLTLWSTAPAIGDLSATLSLPVQLRELQEQLYHLRWSAKDVAERALQEGLKQAKVPGVTGQAVQEIISQALEKLEVMQVPMPDYALKSAGAAVIHSRTSPSLRDAKAKVFLYSLPLMDYMRSPELILEGFKEEHEEQGTFLGQFTFLAALNPSQTFQLKVWYLHKEPKYSSKPGGGISQGGFRLVVSIWCLNRICISDWNQKA
ncbi:hypothetical protein Q9233_017188 [Columba guinea]|nr:hypothetical protein Q9233_017188 [Columba guinea]